MATVAIAVVVAMIAVPGMSGLVRDNRAATQANGIISALALARSEAVTRGRPVTLCPSDGAVCLNTRDWHLGWMVFADGGAIGSYQPATDQLIRRFDGLGTGSTLRGSHAFVRYDAAGFLADAGAPTFLLKQAECQGQQARSISVSPQGRTALIYTGC